MPGTNACHLSESARIPVEVASHGVRTAALQQFNELVLSSNAANTSIAVASSYTGKRKSFSFPDALQGGGDNMDFVTWSELIYLLISLVTLTFAILSYLNSKKR